MQSETRHSSWQGQLREGSRQGRASSERIVAVSTIGVQNDKAQAHNLDLSGLAAIRFLDEASDIDEDGAEEPSVIGLP